MDINKSMLDHYFSLIELARQSGIEDVSISNNNYDDGTARLTIDIDYKATQSKPNQPPDKEW